MNVIPNMTLIDERVCDGCGELVKVYEMTIIGGERKGEKMIANVGCKCEDMKLAKEAEEIRAQSENQRVLEYFNYYSLISKRLKNASLENFIPTNKSQEMAKKAAVKYVEIFDLDKPINLLITGSFGVGKSHLAKAIADEVMKKINPKTNRNYTAIFISVPKLLRKIRSTYGQTSEITEDEIFDVLETVDLLVLDDLGAEKQSEWSDERLFDVIDSRQGMHTIYTTNYSPADLLEMLGERNFSRIMNEDTKTITIEGKNHRLADL